MTMTAKIRALRDEAASNGDLEMTAIADRALDELDADSRIDDATAVARALALTVEQARADCERVIADVEYLDPGRYGDPVKRRTAKLTAAILAELARRGTPADAAEVERFVNAGWDERDNDNASEWADAWTEGLREWQS
jgi:hypothetical protein